MKTSVYTAILSIFVMSLALMLVGAGFSGALTRLMNTPDNIYEDALAYLQIYMWGLPFLFLYNIANAVFNALGESKKPLYFLIFSTFLNIGLDLLFVAKFHWGVAGVAWATFIAQGLAAVLAVSVLLLKIRKIPEKGRIFDGGLLGGMSRVGIPTMFQMAVVSIGNLFVQALVNSYGSDFIAGYSAALKINGFFTVVITTLGSAVATFTAQNIGAGENGPARSGAARRHEHQFYLCSAGRHFSLYAGRRADWPIRGRQRVGAGIRYGRELPARGGLQQLLLYHFK